MSFVPRFSITSRLIFNNCVFPFEQAREAFEHLARRFPDFWRKPPER